MTRDLSAPLFRSLFISTAILFLSACSKHGPSLKDINANNLVQAGDPNVQRVIGEGTSSFDVIGATTFRREVAAGRLLAVPSAQAKRMLASLARVMQPAAPGSTPVASPTPTTPPADDSLIVGFPAELLGEYQVFGGVITAVSDTQTATLGDLKLTDLPPVHVHPIIATDGTNYGFTLLGCASHCKEGSQESPLITIPIVGVGSANKSVMIDLSTLGKDLNLIQMLDPDGSALKLTTKSAKVIRADYSLSTLVFDVEVHMIPLGGAASDTAAPETVFTVRWYLKLASAFKAAFESRPATEGIGFFMTERSDAAKIERRVRPAPEEGFEDKGPVKYFVKNVPAEYQAALISAFDTWNEKFKSLTGQKIFSYEIVAADDPKAQLLVTGDPRYNIVEWDRVNAASYGGLGPAMANQFTGEIFSANVLLQGPTIVQMYSKWFKTAQQVSALHLAGRELEAERLFHDTTVALRAQLSGRAAPQVSLQLGAKLAFRVPAQSPPLADPLFSRIDFEPVPVGYSYETYMRGYFHEMLAHELGHNLGLRHNFRGNLGAKIDPSTGGVSDSIMEYLGRAFREVNDIGYYDQMAIQYGYLGTVPERRDLFCTDEDAPSIGNQLAGSAECSSSDATTDPFAYLEGQLGKAIDLLVARGLSTAGNWTVPDMIDDLKIPVNGMAMYAATAEKTAATWTSFFTGGDRPSSPGQVKAYVLSKLKSHLCDPTIADVLKAKAGDAERAKTRANLDALHAKVWQLVEPLKICTQSELACE